MVACSVMSGDDRLGGDTVTDVVSHRSEVGQGILGTKTCRGKYDILYDVVYKVVMSSMSCMSSDCSVTEHRDTMSCLDPQPLEIPSLGTFFYKKR